MPGDSFNNPVMSGSIVSFNLSDPNRTNNTLSFYLNLKDWGNNQNLTKWTATDNLDSLVGILKYNYEG